MQLLRLPDHLHLITSDALHRLPVSAATGQEDVAVGLHEADERMTISLRAETTAVRGLHLRWNERPPPAALWQRDAWGRQDGEQGWKTLTPHEPMPWYFHVHHGDRTDSYGVGTNPNAVASWQVDPEGVSLFLDTRNGGEGVLLGGRALELATIMARPGVAGETAFSAARAFCAAMVTEVPRARDEIFYGGNNWYYAYGQISHDSCLADAERIGAWCDALPVRPYMLIDDGWQVARGERYNSGPWNAGNKAFPDMARLASAMKAVGTRPGLWYRPLVTCDERYRRFRCGHERAPDWSESGFSLDPTFPEVQALLRADAARLSAWGYELIKHDFTIVDLLGSWLNAYEPTVHPARGWHFHDRSRTNAEIVKQLYRDIREAAEPARILGCQTMGHLCVGSVDLQRTGGDVSGREWERTRRMGPNALAFRATQHGIFFQVDADCAAITPEVPWDYARQWLDLLAHSGTPLFVSADPRAMNDAAMTTIGTALATAAAAPALAEPLDWLETPAPRQWKCGEERRSYAWAPEVGCAPEGLIPGDAVCLLG